MEYIDGTEKFELESLLVKLTVETQRRLYLEDESIRIVNPHANLRTNALTQEEKGEFIATIIRDITMTCEDLSLA
jgi:hypothetical protein